MNRPLAAALALSLGACSSVTPSQQATLTTSAVGAATTLGQVAAANNKTAARIIADGQLVCQVGPVFVAALGYNVTGAPKAAMDAACSALGGIGTALPAGTDPASVKAVAVALKPPA
jgi:hypothetical protein